MSRRTSSSDSDSRSRLALRTRPIGLSPLDARALAGGSLKLVEVPLLVEFALACVHDLGAFAAGTFAPRAAHIAQLFARFSALESDAIDGLAPGFARGFEQHAELGQALHDLGTPFVLNFAHEALSIEARSHRSIPQLERLDGFLRDS